MRPPLSKRRISELIYVTNHNHRLGYSLRTREYNGEYQYHYFTRYREALEHMRDLREDAYAKPWLFPFDVLALHEWAKIHAYRRRQLDQHHNQLTLQE